MSDRPSDDYASLYADMCTQQETNSPKRLKIVDDDSGEDLKIVGSQTGSDGLIVRVKR